MCFVRHHTHDCRSLFSLNLRLTLLQKLSCLKLRSTGLQHFVTLASLVITFEMKVTLGPPLISISFLFIVIGAHLSVPDLAFKSRL